MRTLAVLAVVLVIAIGWRARHPRPAPPWQDSVAGKWLAARGLPGGHQLSATDLERPRSFAHRIGLAPIDSLVGLHIGPALSVKSPVKLSDLTPLPALRPPDSATVRFVVNLASTDVAFGALVQDSGWVLLCQGDRSPAAGRPCIDLALRVMASHADSAARSPTWVVVEAPSCRANELASVLVSEKLKLLSVRGPTAAVPCPKPTVPKRRPSAPACPPQRQD